MKKALSFILSLVVILSSCSISAFASNTAVLDISESNVGESVSPMSYGVCLNPNGNCLESGLSSNLIVNSSFEDEENGWEFDNIKAMYSNSDAMNKNNHNYETLTLNGKGAISNVGYSGDEIHFGKDESYDFSCLIKNIDFDGKIYACIDSKSNSKDLVQLSTTALSKNNWTKLETVLTSVKDEKGKLSIIFNGEGSLEIDDIILSSQLSYGYGENTWKYSSINQKFFDTLTYLNPKFVVLPMANDFSWENSVGAVEEREYSPYLYNFGVHEYFQLCSDLESSPIPSFSLADYSLDSDDYLNLKQNILNMIEYATSDALTSYYGALRSANGSESPFDLRYIAILDSNECYNDIKSAIESKYKDVTVLCNDDLLPISNADEKAKGIKRGNMKATTLDGAQLVESNALAYYTNMFCNVDNGNDLALVYFNNEDSFLAPSYYSQMLLANNIGDEKIATSLVFEKKQKQISTSITVDRNNQIIYIQYANCDSSQNISVKLDGFGDINLASKQFVCDYATAYNDFNKQYVAISQDEIEANADSFTFKADANSVGVVRICYGDATEDKLYQINNDSFLKTKKYVPVGVVVILVALGVSIPIGTVGGYFIYTKVISKKRKK